mmetsp:Transcript_10734/g.20065  ORF Transcript_10734/g.20065 Transcript_10734/m.20065 type:complete len:292 (+) Transcript_10734:247-1122(+)
MIHVSSTNSTIKNDPQRFTGNTPASSSSSSGPQNDSQEENLNHSNPPLVELKSPTTSIANLDALSMQPISDSDLIPPLGLVLDNHNHTIATPTGTTKNTTIYVGVGDNHQQDDVSAPTVEGSFLSEEDEDFSLISEKDFLSTLEMNFPSLVLEEQNDDLLSLSSINTKALLQITELRKRLRIQENTKLELLNQCLRLESRLEKHDCKHAYLKIYKAENNRLREATAKMERDFMNDMNDIVTKMALMEKDYKEKLKDRDDYIERLEQELHLLKIAKNLDLVVTTHESEEDNS